MKLYWIPAQIKNVEDMPQPLHKIMKRSLSQIRTNGYHRLTCAHRANGTAAKKGWAVFSSDNGQGPCHGSWESPGWGHANLLSKTTNLWLPGLAQEWDWSRLEEHNHNSGLLLPFIRSCRWDSTSQSNFGHSSLMEHAVPCCFNSDTALGWFQSLGWIPWEEAVIARSGLLDEDPIRQGWTRSLQG